MRGGETDPERYRTRGWGMVLERQVSGSTAWHMGTMGSQRNIGLESLRFNWNRGSIGVEQR